MRAPIANLDLIPAARAESAIYRTVPHSLIILPMVSEANGQKQQVRGIGPEFLKGCPVCEHSDPELERDLRAFAQLLLEIHLAKRKTARELEKGRGD